MKTNSLEIADFLGKRCSYSLDLTGICSLNNLRPNSILFISSEKKLPFSSMDLKIIKSCLSIVRNKDILPKNFPQIISDNPRLDFTIILRRFFTVEPPHVIHPTSLVSENSMIHKTVSIGAYSIVETNVTIGQKSIIGDNVIIRKNTIIGANTKIGSGTIIGDHGFGFEFHNNIPIRIPHVGNVIIKDYVEVGSNCIISKATIDSTIINNHVKIADMTHIAHNVIIGEYTLIAGGKINGSVLIGKNCWLSPGTCIQNKVTIGDNSMIGTGSIVVRNIPANVVAYGNPAVVIRTRK